MRSPLALLAIATVSAGACSCGGAHSAAHTTSRAAASPPTPGSVATASTASAPLAADYAKTDGDRDNDVGASHDDTRNSGPLDFGHEASASEKRAIAALIKRYYAVALAEDGAGACALIYSPISETITEDFGTAASPPGPPYMHGTTCATVMTGLFKHLHAQLTVEAPRLEVTRVRLEEHHGVALLSFGAMPERTISVRREGRAWRMTALIDNELP